MKSSSFFWGGSGGRQGNVEQEKGGLQGSSWTNGFHKFRVKKKKKSLARASLPGEQADILDKVNMITLLSHLRKGRSPPAELLCQELPAGLTPPGDRASEEHGWASPLTGHTLFPPIQAVEMCRVGQGAWKVALEAT